MTQVETWIANPVLGDMPVEITYSDYEDFGGIKFPTHIVQKQGGQTTLDLTVTNAQANVPNAALQVPGRGAASDAAAGGRHVAKNCRWRVVPRRRNAQ